MKMRRISAKTIITAVSRLCIDSNCKANKDLISLLKMTQQRERGKDRKVITAILKNVEIAECERIPICQDTGIAVVFLEIGNNVKIDLGSYSSVAGIVQEGVRKGYKSGYLRKSVVESLSRINTGDNTPAIVHEKIVAGDHLKIKVLIKGFGAENMAKTKMLPPNAKECEIKKFVLESIRQASSNPCPPVIVGIGIGGTMQKAASLAEEALLEPVKSDTFTSFSINSVIAKPKAGVISRSHSEALAEESLIKKLEKELLREINKLNIGPAGLGGKTTALSVRIKTFPTHIAGLPVAVNISCWANRHKEITLNA